MEPDAENMRRVRRTLRSGDGKLFGRVWDIFRWSQHSTTGMAWIPASRSTCVARSTPNLNGHQYRGFGGPFDFAKGSSFCKEGVARQAEISCKGWRNFLHRNVPMASAKRWT
jgi:hypothetical protein